MASDNEGVVLNGISAQVNCKKGFTRSGYQAVCSRGEWVVSGKLCKESSCIIRQISNGAFTVAVEKKKWKIFGYEKWIEYEKISLGRTINPGSSVHVSCDAEYSFQGKGRDNVSVKCSFGEWDKDPVCRITGSPHNEKAETTSDELAVGRTGFVNTTKGSAIETVRPLLVSVPSQTVSEDLKPALNVSNTFHSCYCTYTIRDDTLAAYAGTELLQYGSKIKNNCTVKFHCYQIGYARLHGPNEIECHNCQWTSVEFPRCLQSEIGETNFQINSKYKPLPGGIIGIEKGNSLSITCYSNGYDDYPTWAGPQHITRLSVSHGFDYYSSQYYKQLNITNIDEQHNGFYQCFIPEYSPSIIIIQDLEPFFGDWKCRQIPGQGRRRATMPKEDRYLVLTDRRHRNMNATLLQQHLRSATGTTVSTQTVRNRLYGVGLCIFILRDRGSRNNPAFVHESVRFGGGGVLVYGGISIDGRTDLYIIRDGPLTARRYRDEILRPIVVLYAAAIGDDFILMEDNCGPRRATLVEDFDFEKGIVRMEWPACSTDMNTIEHVWNALGRRVAGRQLPAQTLQELERALLEEWDRIPQIVINSLIDSMPQRGSTFLAVRGNHTPY
ncbi:transposable element Tcb2 transposase [Trichonephila clavipes]|nr:transposable element Tcb2 transposase [Trichonephila clavipes]